MKMTKRILAFVLCFAMFVGMLPMFALRADAAETVLDAAIFCSDVHGSTSDLSSVLGGVKTSGVDYSSIGFVGDTCLTVANTTSTVQSALGDTNISVMFSYAASHDTEGGADISTNWNYSGEVEGVSDYYLVYTIRETDMQNSSDAATAAPAFTTWYNGLTDAEKALPIFILSHRPLHARRNDNAGAATWYSAISAAAESSDIVFFWAHNHTSENEVDIAAYYVAKDGDETFTVYNGDTVTPNFTYMNAGYINANNQNPGRINVATTVQITADSLIFQDYTTSGVYTGTYAHNTTVTREFAGSTDSGSTEETEAPTEETTAPTEAEKVVARMTISEGSGVPYVVGDVRILYKMYVTYEDGTTGYATQDDCTLVITNDDTGAEVTEAEALSTAGSYSATVTYLGYTCGTKLTFTVSESGDSAYELLNLVINGAEVTADVKDVSSDATVAAAMGTVEGIDEYVAYDITATLAEGETATVSIPVSTAWAEGELNVYYITPEGTVSDETFEVSYADGYVTFTVTHFSTYAVSYTEGNGTDVEIPGSSTTTTEEKIVYVLTDTIADGDEVLIVSANSSSGYILGSDTDADNTVIILSGQLTVGDTASNYTYIENYGSGLVWTVGEGLTFTSGDYKLGVTKTSYTYFTSYSLTTDASASNASYNWTYSGYTLKDSTNSRYAYYSRSSYGGDDWSSWDQSESSQNVYIYKKVTATETTTTGTPDVTHSINITVDGEAATAVTASNVVPNETKQLGFEFVSDPSGYELTATDVTWTATTNNGVATVDANGLVTFSGVAGTETIQVSYTWDGNTISNTLVITTTAMSYSMNIVEETATVKIGADLTLNFETKNSEGTAIEDATITWSSSDESIATVDANGVVTGVAAGDVTITATWTDPAGVEHTDTVTVEVVDAVYALNIDQGDSVIHKGVQNGQTLALTATLTRDEVAVENPTLTWSIVSGGNIATIDASTGTLTFSGEEGDVQVRVTYKVNDNMTLEDYITVHVHKSTAITPAESTTDFPRWPDDGAVRFDKTAQAVGNFSNTGVAQMELSLAGIPAGGSEPFDVVLVLDLSNSMKDNSRTEYLIAAAKAFMETICLNADGTWNGLEHGVSIISYNIDPQVEFPANTTSAYTDDMKDISSIDDYNEAVAAIDALSRAGGTDYAEALKHGYEVLNATKDPARKQYLIFMSDGAPTSYAYLASSQVITSDKHTESTIATGVYTENGVTYNAYLVDQGTSTGNTYELSTSTLINYDEYYSYLMKQNGVEVYSVGLAISSTTGMQVLSHISSAADTETDSADNSHAFFVSDGDSSKLTAAFTQMGTEMMAAATNIEVADKITDEYEMIFQWPAAVTDENKVDGQDFYIEVVNYELDSTTHERNGNYDVLLRVYLTENDDGTLAISKLVKIDDVTSTSAGTTTELTTTPVYTAVSEGDKGYFNLVDGAYVYVADGTGAYKMTEGATVSGTSDTVELHTPYFSYTASDKIIKWHVSETAENSEIALRYFLYLTGSLESVEKKLEEGDEGYVAPGTYPTNDYATLEYTNFKGNDCLQYFPKPQLTWNGAQVSYVFYLVNENGVPVNTAGREVTFAEAVFVTKIYTEAVVWNEDEGKTSLDATKIADDLLPDDYKLYDSTTQYEIHVYQDESANDLGNRFIITAGNGTTLVYNTKAGTKYSAPGTYTAADVDSNFDFANTTVAFAVVWERKLVEDTVVIDFGLPVDINVTTNDFVYNSINAIGTETPTANINDGLYTESALSTKIDESTGMSGILTLSGHTAQIMNENVIRFTPGSMQINAPVKFNYETTTEYYEDGAVKTAFLYSSVTVIPATTVYYEDSFLTLKSYTVTYNEDGTSTSTEDATTKWTQEGTTINGTQAQDRPGEAQISADIDADNLYGYDGAYESMFTFSMGSARKITVDKNTRGEATFTFYGTGFDVIGVTSNATGTLIVQLYEGASATDTAVKSLIVDTYYGYTQNEDGEWVVSVNDPNALYQVPVMKMSGLEYKQYTVKIIAGYNSYFDNVDGSTDYDLYLDAIRIYDPTGVASGSITNETVSDAYEADGEGWPQYIELRNNIIAASNYTVTENEDGTVTVSGTNLSGAIFIDSSNATTSIADYVSYGPNNELYLAAGQSVSFALDQTYASIIADVQIAMKLGNGSSVSYEMYNAASDGTKSNIMTGTLTTATDLYYSIKDLASGTIVITNTGGGILSITNIKVTYTQNPNGTSASSEENLDSGVMTTSLYMDEEVATAAVMSLRSVPAYDETVPEETVPETTVPEETEPEETVPETTVPEETEPEVTEPETTVPEETVPETTVPEETEPETEPSEPTEQEKVEELIGEVGKIIKKLFGWLFG